MEVRDVAAEDAELANGLEGEDDDDDIWDDLEEDDAEPQAGFIPAFGGKENCRVICVEEGNYTCQMFYTCRRGLQQWLPRWCTEGNLSRPGPTPTHTWPTHT